MRDTIFISHATPEDNEFTIWLSSRLELLGYKVWIDKTELIGGEVFWDDIESAIKNRSIKFLLVYSENICYNAQKGKIKSGIQREIDFANKVINDHPDLKDYLIILHLDDAPYDLFPGSQNLNQIPFNLNWADGLSLLLKKLIKDSVPQTEIPRSDKTAEWYLENYIVKNPIIKKKELYYTNWWSIQSSPDCFYIIRFATEQQAIAIQNKNVNELVVVSSNCLTTFKKELNFELDDNFGINRIVPSDVYEIKISELVLGYERDSFPTFRDAENHFKKLLKRAFHLYLKENKLSWYEMANKNIAYYHTPTSLPSSKVSFYFPFQKKPKAKKKNLFGKYLAIGKWHFAISVKPALFPLVGLHLKSHLIFTSNGFKPLEDKGLQHAHRRKKGKRMFNEEWRDLLVGFVNSLKNVDNLVQIKSGTAEPIIFKSDLETFWSDHGYYDPKDLERQAIFAEDTHDEIEKEIE